VRGSLVASQIRAGLGDHKEGPVHCNKPSSCALQPWQLCKQLVLSLQLLLRRITDLEDDPSPAVALLQMFICRPARHHRFIIPAHLSESQSFKLQLKREGGAGRGFSLDSTWGVVWCSCTLKRGRWTFVLRLVKHSNRGLHMISMRKR
jgi:hypothetical protein